MRPSEPPPLDDGPFVQALQHHLVSASVMHVDHYRVQRRAMSIRTDYIVLIQPQLPAYNGVEATKTVATATVSSPFWFDPFMMSKTFKAFRGLASDLSHLVKGFKQQQQQLLQTKKPPSLSSTTIDLIHYCTTVTELIESQPQQIMPTHIVTGMTFTGVKALAKQRTEILNKVLEATCQHFPDTSLLPATEVTFVNQVAKVLQTFFLTDHCLLDEIHNMNQDAPTAAGGAIHYPNKLLQQVKQQILLKIPSSSTSTSNVEDHEGKGEEEENHHELHDDNNPILNPLAGLWHMIPKDIKTLKKNLNHAKQEEAQQIAQATPEQPEAQQPEAQFEALSVLTTSSGTKTSSTQVIPLTHRERRSVVLREQDALILQTLDSNVNLVMEDEEDEDADDGDGNEEDGAPPVLPTTAPVKKTTTTTTTTTTMANDRVWISDDLNNNNNTIVSQVISWYEKNQPKYPRYLPWLLFGTVFVLIQWAGRITVQLHADYALLFLLAAYSWGYYTPRPEQHHSRIEEVAANLKDGAAAASSSPLSPFKSVDVSGRLLLRRTSVAQLQQQQRQPHDALTPTTTNKKIVISSPGLALMQDNDEEEEEEKELAAEDGVQPMSEFPVGAALGSVTNCWGLSHAPDFKIRGSNYLQDKKKVPSAPEFLFPHMRGVELFLTDACPENVGQNPRVLQGKLRDLPTFLLNFRLPWGVLVLYFEIPSKFVPYLRAGYEIDKIHNKEELEEALKTMTPSERCACRFFMNNDAYKNSSLKIVPIVVKGPWVVRSVVGGKPALIGNKVPIHYVYQPPEEGEEEEEQQQQQQLQSDQSGSNPTPKKRGKALYWEADLDIAASSAARGILSVARAYTQVLTMDLGFVVQGNHEDELPEQMLIGCRLHGVDPLTAPAYPPMKRMTTHTRKNNTNNHNNNPDEDDLEPPALGSSLAADDGSVTPMST